MIVGLITLPTRRFSTVGRNQISSNWRLISLSLFVGRHCCVCNPWLILPKGLRQWLEILTDWNFESYLLDYNGLWKPVNVKQKRFNGWLAIFMIIETKDIAPIWTTQVVLCHLKEQKDPRVLQLDQLRRNHVAIMSQVLAFPDHRSSIITIYIFYYKTNFPLVMFWHHPQHRSMPIANNIVSQCVF